MSGKSRSVSFYSALLILALIAFGACNVQGFQTTQMRTETSQLIPPPPSAPYWTYETLGDVWAVAVSQDGSTIVAGSFDKVIYVFGRQSNTPIWTYTAPNAIYTVAISANGSTIVVGTAAATDGGIYVFGRQNNTPIWIHNIASCGVFSVAVSADGNTIVAGTADPDSKIYAFSRQSNTPIWTYSAVAPNTYVNDVAVSADGNTIVAGTSQADHKVYAFGRMSSVPLWTYKTTLNDMYSVAVSSDGNTIAAGGSDGHVRAFARQDNASLWDYDTGHDVGSVAVSLDGTTISAGGADGYLRVFERTSNTTLVQYDAGAPIFLALAVSSDGSTIACGTCWTTSPNAYFFSKSTGLLWTYSVGDDIGGGWSGSAVEISADGSLVAYGCNDNKLYVFQYDTVAPVLGPPSILPASPIDGQSINVSISVTDNLAISAVTLRYRVGSASSWSSSAMTLTGAAYRTTIGPFSLGDVVCYYVNASDTSGNSAASPGDSPLSYYTIEVGTPSSGGVTSQGIQWTSVLLGAGLGAVIAIVVSFALLRGKKSRR